MDHADVVVVVVVVDFTVDMESKGDAELEIDIDSRPAESDATVEEAMETRVTRRRQTPTRSGPPVQLVQSVKEVFTCS